MIVAVALAGGIGAALRVWLDDLLSTRSGSVRGIAMVNLSGSLLIGLLTGVGIEAVPGEWPTILAVGFLGGYTTFSTAALQAAEQLMDGKWRTGAAYSLGILAGASALAGVGICLGTALAGTAGG